MRENIGLFRGKRIDNGEWVEGWYVHTKRHHCIITGCIDDEYVVYGHYATVAAMYVVDPTSIGECTSLKDKNGKLIFEGDIFRMDDDLISVIIFKDGCFRLETYGLRGTYTESGYDECGGGWGVIECEPIDWYYIHDMEISGTIHDNPELLKGGEG